MRLFVACGMVVASLLVLCLKSAHAQSDSYDVDAPERRGQAGMAWLQIGGSARVEGMGGAGIGLMDDPSTVFYNSAGAASVKGIAVYGNNTRWPGDVRVNHFAVLAEAGPVTLGAQFQSMDFGTIIGTVIEDLSATNRTGFRETGDVGVTAWTAGLVIASQVTDRFNAGMTVKYGLEDYDNTQVYSFVTGSSGVPIGYVDKTNDNRVGVWILDVGTQYNTGFRDLQINMSFRNLAGNVSYVEQDFDLPLTYQIGFSIDAIEAITGTPSDRHTLHTEITGVDRRDVPLDVAFGVEYVVRLLDSSDDLEVALRMGRRPAQNQEGSLGFGGGIMGIVSGTRARIDYSYNDYGRMFDAQRLSLTVYLNQ